MRTSLFIGPPPPPFSFIAAHLQPWCPPPPVPHRHRTRLHLVPLDLGLVLALRCPRPLAHPLLTHGCSAGLPWKFGRQFLHQRCLARYPTMWAPPSLLRCLCRCPTRTREVAGPHLGRMSCCLPSILTRHLQMRLRLVPGWISDWEWNERGPLFPALPLLIRGRPAGPPRIGGRLCLPRQRLSRSHLVWTPSLPLLLGLCRCPTRGRWELGGR